MNKNFKTKFFSTFIVIAAMFQLYAGETLAKDSTDTTPELSKLTLENQSPVIENQGTLIYPEEAKVKGFYGVVNVEVKVNENGDVEDATIISSPNEKLSAAVLKVTKTWKFKPLIKNGKAVASKLQVPIVFKNN
jgi:protein TonB